MIIDVKHPGISSVSKADIREMLVKRYKVKDEKTIFVYGFRTAFGGGKSTGFGNIYDTLNDALMTEPHYRLCRAGLRTRVESSRKTRRELKNRKKKVRGTKKAKIGAKK
jgi:small subunit ribosomal protein S24e